MFHNFGRYFVNYVDSLNLSSSTMNGSLKPSNLQVFEKYFKELNSYYTSTEVHRVSIESTNIPLCLNKMLCLILLEDTDEETTGPCLEYLMEHKVLQTLSTFAIKDVPPGMKPTVLQFCTQFLSKCKQKLLPHVNIYKPICNLIEACGETVAAPGESEEVAFLCTLCAKFIADPNLAAIFIKGSKFLCSNFSAQDSDSLSDNNKNDITFPIVSSLLALLESPDSRVVVKTCEGLFLISSVPHITATKVLLRHTKFCSQLTNKLVIRFSKIPEILDPANIEKVYIAWGMQGPQKYNSDFKGKQFLIDFLCWFDYIDRLISSAQPSIAQALSTSVKNIFLKSVLLPSLLQPCEQKIITATGLLIRLIQCVSSPILSIELKHFVFGKYPDDESNLYKILLVRCNHVCDELTIITLRLFEALLDCGDDEILDILILKSVKHRSYLKKSCDFDTENETDSSNKDNIPKMTNSSEIVEKNIQKKISFQLHDTICKYITILPDNLRSSILSSDSSIDAYIYDAQIEFSRIKTKYSGKSWPKTPYDTSIENTLNEPFAESELLKIVLDKMTRILTQSYPVNLQLTCLASKLVMIPHPLIDELLLSSDTDLVVGARSYYSVLNHLINDAKNEFEQYSNNFEESLLSTRNAILAIPGSSFKSANKNHLALAFILIEEFGKELSAIAFVKQNARDLEKNFLC